MYAIKTEKLTKKYKEKTAVSNLDLKINEGEMYGLLGVNGAGKTTTNENAHNAYYADIG